MATCSVRHVTPFFCATTVLSPFCAAARPSWTAEPMTNDAAANTIHGRRRQTCASNRIPVLLDEERRRRLSLPALSGGLLRLPGAAKHVRDRVIPLVTRVFVYRNVYLG